MAEKNMANLARKKFTSFLIQLQNFSLYYQHYQQKQKNEVSRFLPPLDSSASCQCHKNKKCDLSSSQSVISENMNSVKNDFTTDPYHFWSSHLLRTSSIRTKQ